MRSQVSVGDGEVGGMTGRIWSVTHLFKQLTCVKANPSALDEGAAGHTPLYGIMLPSLQ